MLLMESILCSTKNLKGIQNIDKYAFKNKRQTVLPHQTFKSKKSYFHICYLILCSSLPTVYNICVSHAVYSTEYLLLMYEHFIENFQIELFSNLSDFTSVFIVTHIQWFHKVEIWYEATYHIKQRIATSYYLL